MKNLPIFTHTYYFNPEENGGEAIFLVTKFYKNRDGDIYTTQVMAIQSYCSAAELQFVGGTITPEKLRELANQLESTNIQFTSKRK